MSMEIKETVRDFALGLVTIGTTAVQIIPIPVSGGGTKGILLKTPGPSHDTPNTVTVYIGRANVKADQSIEAGGYPLDPGQSVTIPVEKADEWFAISGTAGQVINWINL